MQIDGNEEERKIDKHLRQGFILLPMLFSSYMIIKVLNEL